MMSARVLEPSEPFAPGTVIMLRIVQDEIPGVEPRLDWPIPRVPDGLDRLDPLDPDSSHEGTP